MDDFRLLRIEWACTELRKRVGCSFFRVLAPFFGLRLMPGVSYSRWGVCFSVIIVCVMFSEFE